MTKIHFLDILIIFLPFTNEIANVLTASKIPLFENLYKQCIDPYILDNKLLKKISENKICKGKNILYRLLIDLIALSGILLLVAKNAINYNYTTAILSGLNIILLSFIIPNLFLHKCIHFITIFLNIKSKYINLLVGFICIGILLILSVIFDKIIEETTKNKKFYFEK